ncbi:flagellar assembly factor FliW [Sanguibacter gelidistatuariae]|uniref:Flagellar assembly factor FliW n=1 Tax=Sanguibacter gelidistatuariae TaxID=1814289 RepID=A0A1G6PV84_9MICO|nr:flagellar assembly protein FliW [Sanguibacter gelidistatuariae]SDC83881.1 flagellar assembly factor FliW [Sanguibacter gelidistatuariae]
MITEVHFVEKLPGLSAGMHFSLASLDDNGLLFSLRGTGDDPTRLFLVQPGPYFEEYTPSLEASSLAAVHLDGGTDPRCAVLVIVTPRTDAAPATANLLAPVILNTETGDALQVILEGTPWPLRAPFAAA